MVLLVWGLKYSLLPSEFLTFEKKKPDCVCVFVLSSIWAQGVSEGTGRNKS